MIKNLLSKWKISVGFVGGALVVATAYGTCSIDPDEDAIKEKVLGKETQEEAKAEEKKDSEALPKVVEEKPVEEKSAENPQKDDASKEGSSEKEVDKAPDIQ